VQYRQGGSRAQIEASGALGREDRVRDDPAAAEPADLLASAEYRAPLARPSRRTGVVMRGPSGSGIRVDRLLPRLAIRADWSSSSA
jgi:hypothetical protein